jgi:hypothetical protein
MDFELAALKSQMALLHAELRLLNAKKIAKPPAEPSPWLSLKEASALLRFESARSLKQRIRSGKFPPDCCQQIPSPTGKRTIYLVNVQRYLKRLN